MTSRSAFPLMLQSLKSQLKQATLLARRPSFSILAGDASSLVSGSYQDEDPSALMWDCDLTDLPSNQY